jgi:hypothetical protein
LHYKYTRSIPTSEVLRYDSYGPVYKYEEVTEWRRRDYAEYERSDEEGTENFIDQYGFTKER